MIVAEIIPVQLFEALPMWLLWVVGAFAVGLLVVGADRAVTAAVRLSLLLGLSKIVIGATIVSLGTTAPETAVSVNASIRAGFEQAQADRLEQAGELEEAAATRERAAAKAGLALGNGVGSIICDTALIFGLACLLTRLPKDRFVLRRQGWLQLGSGVLLVGVAGLMAILSGPDEVYLPRAVGVLFLALLVGYMYLTIRWSRVHPEVIEAGLETELGPDVEEQVRREASTPGRAAWVVVGNVALLAVGLALVIFGSEIMIGSVVTISTRMGVPQPVLAVTVVALGTSLPELVTAVAAILKGHPDLLVGNIIGADILNVLFVIGASAAAVPLRVDPEFFLLYFPTMLAALVLLRIWIWLPGDRFRRWQGIPLLALYVIFTAVVVWRGMTPPAA